MTLIAVALVLACVGRWFFLHWRTREAHKHELAKFQRIAQAQSESRERIRIEARQYGEKRATR